MKQTIINFARAWDETPRWQQILEIACLILAGAVLPGILGKLLQGIVLAFQVLDVVIEYGAQYEGLEDFVVQLLG